MQRTTWLCISMVPPLEDRCRVSVGWKNVTRWLTGGGSQIWNSLFVYILFCQRRQCYEFFEILIARVRSVSFISKGGRGGRGCGLFSITSLLSLCQSSQWLKEGEDGLTPALATFVKKMFVCPLPTDWLDSIQLDV